MSKIQKTLAANKTPSWIISLSDLISLLLTFFVMLFSMSTLMIDKWEEITDMVSKTPEVTEKKDDNYATNKFNLNPKNHKISLSLNYLKSIIDHNLDPENQYVFSSKIYQNSLVVSFPAPLAFQSASYELYESAYEQLQKISHILHNLKNQISVYGHTDPQPLNSLNQLKSNWDLSILRALFIANQLKKAGYIRPIRVYGYSYAKFIPLSHERISFLNARRFSVVIEAYDGIFP